MDEDNLRQSRLIKKGTLAAVNALSSQRSYFYRKLTIVCRSFQEGWTITEPLPEGMTELAQAQANDALAGYNEANEVIALFESVFEANGLVGETGP